ncbi:hypothetical protein KY348_06555 [Candidatus Woesearchaeota archaeon]|nr:hypothetical protein [Candidatus Woesearchaeota archaeon]
MKEEILIELGLNHNEAKVYLALIKLGPSMAGKVAEVSKVHRRTVYDVLESLMDKGLVSFIIKANRKSFEATNPKRLMELLKEKEKDLDNLLPELIAAQRASKEVQTATVYKGKKGVKNIFEDVLKYNKSLVFGSSGRFKETLGPYFTLFQKRKKEKGRGTEAIVSERIKGTDIHLKTPGKIRFLPRQYESPISTLVYGNKVAIVVWTEDPIGFLIESKTAAKSFTNYFKVMWGMAKE